MANVRINAQNTEPLTWKHRLNIVTGTARGIQFLHSLGEKPLVHGDIKSANILLDHNFEPRIGDFGLAREGPSQQYTYVSRVHGTRPYLPDEFLRSKRFSVKVDVYSFGVVLFEVATGLRPYDKERKEKFLRDHVLTFKMEELGDLADPKAGADAGASARGLLVVGRHCVERLPSERPDMAIVLNAVSALNDCFISYLNDRRFLERQQSIDPSTATPQQLQIFHELLKKDSPPPMDRKSPLPLLTPINQGVIKVNEAVLQIPIEIPHPPSTSTAAPPLQPQPLASPMVDELVELDSSNIPLVSLLNRDRVLASSDKTTRKATSSQSTESIPSESISETDVTS